MRSLTPLLLGFAMTLALARGAPGAGAPAPTPTHNGAAFWIKVSAQQDGSFTVSNQRNGFSKTYKAKN